ncbi:MAG TPA: saccharopine dehydrogenase NADP-binding domain-containing protein [Polyangiales bacterium]|nr:saccharopine dehydrogenase NADP-binding domain-containing protein [Polyangiales bacterium]
MTNNREYDVILYGATGYTGRLVAVELIKRARGARLALAGRNLAKLHQLRDVLGQPALPVLAGDSNDASFLTSLARKTAVVCTTVGPYAQYGEALVAACAQTGTDYCDVTGEVPWVRRMIDSYGETAQRSGARLVHCCGFDSIPSDLGVWFLQTQAKLRYGKPCDRVRGAIIQVDGDPSGGTLASIDLLMQEARKDPAVAEMLVDPYNLNPLPERSGPDGQDPALPFRDPDYGWTAPWIMATANTRVVRRTNAVLGYPYGRDFRYAEFFAAGDGIKGLAVASGITLGLIATVSCLALPPLATITRRFMPKPGAGMNAERLAKGSFTMELVGTQGNAQIRVRVSTDRDPLYAATAIMLAESALCLTQDGGRLAAAGGSWTPAAALGTPLVERLNQAGVRFVVLD